MPDSDDLDAEIAPTMSDADLVSYALDEARANLSAPSGSRQNSEASK